MKYVIYKRPDVRDKHYDEYSWQRFDGPFDDEYKAREDTPTIGSSQAKGYNYTIVPFKDHEDIKSSIEESEKQRRKSNLS